MLTVLRLLLNNLKEDSVNPSIVSFPCKKLLKQRLAFVTVAVQSHKVKSYKPFLDLSVDTKTTTRSKAKV
jgi:hypothetical protein